MTNEELKNLIDLAERTGELQDTLDVLRAFGARGFYWTIGNPFWGRSSGAAFCSLKFVPDDGAEKFLRSAVIGAARQVLAFLGAEQQQ